MDFLIPEKVFLFKERIFSGVKIVALLRVRNEQLILQDTLEHLSGKVDVIVAYDDCSTDATLKILKNHPKVVCVLKNRYWRRGARARLREESRHRQRLLTKAKEIMSGVDWFMYSDADERFVGNIKEDLKSGIFDSFEGIRIRLFDAYITSGDCKPYDGNRPLLNFREFFGPEYRDILMIWRNRHDVSFEGLDSREPTLHSNNITRAFMCQHYGKSLSVEHWESTCQYYITHFPAEPYGNKWRARVGKAVHVVSDFGTPLYRWGKDLFSASVQIK